MKFSLFFEMQIAGPEPATEAQLFHDCLEQAVLADALGFHCIWEVEHHGLYEYAHSSAREIFLSFVAARTKRIRVGHGCTLLPFRYNHPIRIAERVATLDILSNGRVNWGTARSGSRVEQEAFEVDEATLFDQWREAVEIIPKMWGSEPFAYKGRFFDTPPTQVVPKPVQSPHPPIFAACSRPEDAVTVGDMGLGALNLAMYRDECLAQRVREYRDAVARARPNGRAVTNHFACNPATFVLRDDKKACEYGLRGAMYFTQAMFHYYGTSRPVGPIGLSTDFLPSNHVEGFRRVRNTSASQLSSVIGDCAIGGRGGSSVGGLGFAGTSCPASDKPRQPGDRPFMLPIVQGQGAADHNCCYPADGFRIGLIRRRPVSRDRACAQHQPGEREQPRDWNERSHGEAPTSRASGTTGWLRERASRPNAPSHHAPLRLVVGLTTDTGASPLRVR
jgi:alkanesulfonate monooxygenase SsuD/methylene tetrahydromethanopterin reductase-like flavin-dependent oxidoreductase (luciferase family)